MKIHPVAFAALLSLSPFVPGAFLPAAFGAGSGEGEKAYYHAFYLESALRSFEEAQVAYAEASTLAADEGNHPLAAQALAGHARCLKALGRLEEARRAYENALRLDPNSSDAKAALEDEAQGSATSEVDPELRLRIQALVQKLGGAERENASGDLWKIGNTAVPFLEDGLRSRDVAVVEHCARLLYLLETKEAADGLIRGLDDPDVLFPKLIAEGVSIFSKLGNVPLGREPARVVSVGFEHPSAEVRTAMARFVVGRGGAGRGWLRDSGLVAAIERIGGDEDPAIRRLLLNGPFLSNLDDPQLNEILERVIPPLLGEARRSGDPAMIRDAYSAASSLATDQPAFRPEVIAFADSDDPSMISNVAREACLWAQRGDGSFAEIGCTLLARSLEDSAQPDHERSRVKFLRDLTIPWTDELRQTAFNRVEAAIRGEVKDQQLAEEIVRVIETRSAAGFDDDQFAQIYADIAPTSWIWSAEKGEYLRTQIRQRYLRTSGHNGQTFIEEADVRAARFVRFASAAIVQTKDSEGRRQLLESVPDRFDSAPGAAELVLVAARDTDPMVRVIGYARTSGADRLDIALYPSLIDDVASGWPSAFDLLRGHETRDHADAIAAFLDRRLELRKTPGALDPARVDAWVGSAASALVAALGNKEGADRLRAILEREGRSFLERVGPLLFEIDGPAFASDLASGAVVVPDLMSKDVLRFGSPFCNQIAREIPAERLTVEWMGMHSLLDADVAETLMRKALTSKDASVQLASLDLAPTLAGPDDLPRILELADGGSVSVRAKASETLAKVQARLESRASIELLGPGGLAAALERARVMASSDDPKRRRGAALALGALGDKAAVPMLLDLLEDPDEAVQDAALRGLESLGQSSGGSGG